MEITFDKSAKRFVLNAIGMDVNKEGYIIDLASGEVVLTRKGTSVHIGKFVGYCKGFGLIEDGFENIVELHDYMKAQKENKNG